MKKLKRIIQIAVLALVVLVVGILLAVNVFADKAVKKAIEVGGKKALDVDVTLEQASLSIMGGQLGMKDLVIANPSGYQHDTFMELSSGSVTVNARSLLSDQVQIKHIKLDGITAVLEQKGISGTNLQELLKRIKSDSGEATGKSIHVDTLEIDNVTVKVKLLPVPGKMDTMTLKLAPIKMTDLGSDEKLDMATLAGKIVLAVAEGIIEQGGDILPKAVLTPMVSALGTTLDVSKEVIEGGAKIGEKLLEGTGDAGKEITEGLKGIFKKKDQE